MLLIELCSKYLSVFYWQVQIQGEQGQTVGQVLQVGSPTQQQLQGLTQLVQQGELTEEQQQQVMHTNAWSASTFMHFKFLS